MEMKPSPHSYCHYSFKVCISVPTVSSENAQGMQWREVSPGRLTGWLSKGLKGWQYLRDTARVRICH